MTPLMKFYHDYYAYRDRCRRRETIALIIACIVLVILLIIVFIVWKVEKWTVLNAIKEWKSGYGDYAIIMFVNIADI